MHYLTVKLNKIYLKHNQNATKTWFAEKKRYMYNREQKQKYSHKKGTTIKNQIFEENVFQKLVRQISEFKHSN